MATVNDPPDLELMRNPFFYGWREVTVTLPDGTERLENIPLTREDVLHPQEGDHIMQNLAHVRDASYLRAVFKDRLKNNPDALVLYDCAVDLDLEGERHVCPDIAVLFGAGLQNWTLHSAIFYTAVEGSRPSLIVEVVSPSTRTNDHGRKMTLYHRAEIPIYVILDRAPSDGPLTMQGLRWTEDGYENMELDARGRIWLDAVGVWLGIDNDRAVCYDGDKELGDYSEVTQQCLDAQEAVKGTRDQAVEDRKASEAEIAALRARIAALEAQFRPSNPPTS